MISSRLSSLALLACLTVTAFADDDTAEREERAVAAAVSRASACAVRIETIGGREKVENVLVGEGPTTGLLLTSDGYLVSSSFNFVHEPASIIVTTPSGVRTAAKIVARDRMRMLVLLKIETKEELPTPEIVPREEMRVGQRVIAIGRTLEGDRPRLSIGVLSALERVWGRAIQTDAKISPANYGGPLIDLQGRVLGVLTPLNPYAEGETAGADWYDSGIGFAASLADLMPRLEAMKAGKDLVAGVLGVSMKRGDIYSLPADIAVCQIHSPAYRGGFRAGDRIVEIDGRPITRQVQLRHALGVHYAGDKATIVALRGEQRLTAEVELVDRLEPYRYPLLGVLPMRGPNEAGIVVRYVFPKSVAETSDMKRGDVLLKIDGKETRDVAAAQEIIAAQDPTKKTTVEYRRGVEKFTKEVQLGVMQSEIPAELPPDAKPSDDAGEKPKTGLIDLKLPEEKHDCFALVPSNFHPAKPHALLVWFTPPGKFDKEEIAKRWQDLAERYSVVVLVPRPGEQGRWHPEETAVVRKFIELAVQNYRLDKTRIVVHGSQVGGAMAWLTAVSHRNLIRGVAAVDAPRPNQAVVENDPVQRLFVYSAAAKKSPNWEAIHAGEQSLRRAHVPLVTHELDKPRELNDEELAELMRWVDSLDRL